MVYMIFFMVDKKVYLDKVVLGVIILECPLKTFLRAKGLLNNLSIYDHSGIYVYIYISSIHSSN